MEQTWLCPARRLRTGIQMGRFAVSQPRRPSDTPRVSRFSARADDTQCLSVPLKRVALVIPLNREAVKWMKGSLLRPSRFGSCKTTKARKKGACDGGGGKLIKTKRLARGTPPFLPDY